MSGLQISSAVALPLEEVEITAIRAQGAGGQHVNKVSSAIHLRFNIADSSLPEAHFSALYGGATLAGASLQFKWGRLIDRYGSRIALPCFILMLGLGLAAITACEG